MNSKYLTGADDYSRVMWQCRRGMLELDILLQGFVRRCYRELGSDEKHTFLDLLAQPDPELYALIMDRNGLMEEPYADIVEKIRRSA